MIFVMAGCVKTEIDDEAPPGKEAITTRAESQYYYWYRGEKVYLTKVPDKYYVVCKKENLGSLMAAVARSGGNLDQANVNDFSVDGNKNRTALDATYGNCVWTTVSGIQAASLNDVLYAGPFFTNESNCEAGLTEGFSVRLKNEEDEDKLKLFAEENGAVIVDKSRLMPLWYNLICTPESAGNSMELANKAYESGLFAATDIGLLCSMIFAKKPSDLFNDPAYHWQWNLYNEDTEGMDISFEQMSSITMGTPSVTVAVLDGGFDLTLPDLPVDESWDASSGTSPARLYNYTISEDIEHGTNISSIIHATPDNQIGIVGIASKTRLMNVSVNKNDKSWRDKMAEGLHYAAENGADVLSNSWLMSHKHERISESIDYALKYGRDGKGCIVVFAIGNDNIDVAYHPYSEFPEILTVGGIDSQGERASFSNYGDILDVVAPATLIPIISLYSDEFNLYSGTSFAAPQVAAVAALVLSVTPELTGKEVCDIIEQTAKKNLKYSFGQIRSNGTWDYEVGYGLLDAYAAVTGSLKPLEITNQNITTDAEYIRRSMSFIKVGVSKSAKVTAKALVDNISLTTVSLSQNARMSVESKKDAIFSDVNIVGSSQINAVSQAAAMLENVKIQDKGKLFASASGIKITSSFRVEKGAEMLLSIAEQ